MSKLFNNTVKSLKHIDFKLFASLLVMGLCPTLYTTCRVFLLGQIPGDWSYSIAGQLSWINLIYEVIDEAIILPLYFFMGKVANNKEEYLNRIKTGLIISLVCYIALSILICIFVEPLLFFMATSKDIIAESAIYIRIESIANIFGLACSFMFVCLITLGKAKYVYILTITKTFLCFIFDTFLVSTLNVSANLGVKGIGYSNIIVNVILTIVCLELLHCNGLNIFSNGKMDFNWIKDFAKKGGISGLESFVRNFAYMIMICRMVNVVNEQGTYWVANNFIWGWLLLPVTQLGELIKQQIATDKNAVKNNTIGYFALTFVICGLWLIFIPSYKPFMTFILQYTDTEKLFSLVMLLLGFYILYSFQNIFDCIFYGLGKTNYMLFESVVTNTVYYGAAFVLYKTGLWIPTLTGIALLFGIGNAFDSIVSAAAFKYLTKKNNINILDVE